MFFIFMKGVVVLTFAVVLIWIAYIAWMRNRNRRLISIGDSIVAGKEIEDIALENAGGHTVSKRKNLFYWPIQRMHANYGCILTTYRTLNEHIRKKQPVPDTAEWLLDNFYIIEEQVKVIRRDSDKKYYRKMPLLKSGPYKGFPRIFAIAMDLATFTDGQVDDAVLAGYLNAYQTRCPLYNREISALATFIQLALLEKVRNLCINIQKTLMKWQKGDRIIDNWLKSEKKDGDKSVKRHVGFKSAGEIDLRFLEHLFSRLRRSKRDYSGIQRQIEEQLAKFGANLEQIILAEHSAQSKDTISMGNCITSLRYLSSMDWTALLEATSFVDEILRQDPDGTYPNMDAQTRGYYRSYVEKIASAYGVSEYQIAMEAVTLSKEARLLSGQKDGDNEIARTWHIGYYLLGKGLKLLCERQHKAGRKTGRKCFHSGTRHPGFVYFGGIALLSLALIGIPVWYCVIASPHQVLPAMLAGLGMLLPSVEIAVSAVNFIVCKCTKPAIFPKMDFKRGIPDDMRTFVVVPTLLSKENVQDHIKNLEGQYLRNREKNLLFAVIGAFRDSESELSSRDSGIVECAMDAVFELNRKYAKQGSDIFYFFHRKSQFNRSNNNWFGWERKRGALLEFNDLLLGSTDTSFIASSCSDPRLLNIRYIITLDSDTILPFGMAKKMVETMAHPLNKPIIDNDRGVVSDGYAILQPRIIVNGESSNQTLFSRMAAGYEGLDPYANAISDVYQDLFGEGIYTGKGIYDLSVFQSVLRDAFADDTILSHDLLEGSYGRTGLVTNLKLIDSFPVQYASFALRQHRWVRGDWQLIGYLQRNIRNRNNQGINNPLSPLSKWKIMDNMRRSLFAPAMMFLLVLGFTILPGSIFWLGAAALAISFPFLIALVEYVSSQRYASDRIKRHIPVIIGVKAAFMQSFFSFIMLPYQAVSMLNAILITLGRVLFTKRNMLEWVTMAEVEKTQSNSLQSYWKKMWPATVLTLCVCILSVLFKPRASWMCFILSCFWLYAPSAAYFMSRKKEKPQLLLSSHDQQELRKIARRTYRYFEEFANAKNHFLPPDNYQIDPPRGIAHRTSPTNIGLGLMATLSGRDFGYLGTGKMVQIVQNTLTTAEGLEKWNGHLLNWYDTHTLVPLCPRYVSTVDSGNFCSYLVTLRQGLIEYLHKPLCDKSLADGLIDTLLCADKEAKIALLPDGALQHMRKSETFDPNCWYKALMEFAQRCCETNDSVFGEKAHRMAAEFLTELNRYMPWIEFLQNIPADFSEPNRQPVNAKKQSELLRLMQTNASINDLPQIIAQMLDIIRTLRETEQNVAKRDGNTWIARLESALKSADRAIHELITAISEQIQRIDRLSRANFELLYVEQKKLFAIGYNLEDDKLTNSYYDQLASEARQTSFLAIAKGQIDSEHWYHMGRALTAQDGYKGLISWTGTMFEYLMPLLIMKNYQNTLLDETYSFVIKSQRKYGRRKGTPWGMSESAFNMQDIHHDYQYKAFGIPWLGLKRGLSEDVVVSPYSTMLALLVDPVESVRNIDSLFIDGLGGAYGLYEAADYTPDRLPFDVKRAVVKSYMAHHQGMSLMALNDCLHNNILQQRYDSDPQIHAARLLLQEKIPSRLLFTKEIREKIVPFTEPKQKDSPQRKYTMPDPVLPKAHILSNGAYSVMLTDRGAGYSRTKMAAVNRWRRDSTLDAYGMFLYVRNSTQNAMWSAAYAPLNTRPQAYEVEFCADKAVFKRQDGPIETTTEIVVADADNVEIRRVCLKNTGDKPCEIEVTSYFEVVLNAQAADIAHPAFANLFVETGYIEKKQCLSAYRRTRSDCEKGLWLGNTLVVEGKAVEELQYETDRMQFLGRGRSPKSPIVLERDRRLTNTVGAVLDPVMSLRVKIAIEPGQKSRISFLIATGESREDMLALIDKYASAEDVEKAFRLATTRSRVEAGFLNLQAREMELFQELIRDILFISPNRRLRREIIEQNSKSQPSLWRFCISGDYPVVMVEIKNANRVALLYEILKAHEYWRLLNVRVDLVLLCEAEYSYALPLYSRVAEIIQSESNGNSAMARDVFLLDKNKLSREDFYLLHEVANIVLDGNGPALAEQMRMEEREKIAKTRVVEVEEPFKPIDIADRELIFSNGLGGFNKDGSEYVIQLETGQNTPAPWVNVVANPAFGFIASEAGSVFTWAYNSHQAKLTPWNNDAVSDMPGEAVYITDMQSGALWTTTALPIREEGLYTIRHGFGYSVYEHASHGIKQTLTQFVPVEGTVKVSMMHLKNDSGRDRKLSLTYYVQPVLGVSSQFTAGHIQTSIGENNVLLIKNQYAEAFCGKVCFVDCSVETRSCTGDRNEFFGFGGLDAPDCLKYEALSGNVGTGYDPCAALQVYVTLSAGQSRDIVFTLGVADSVEDVHAVASSFRDIRFAEKCLADVKEFWRDTLGSLHVDTPSASLDLMLNGFLQYQIIACRLWARSGFYQSGGAYGFRDQLQDCLGVAHSWPQMAREQILLHARHQFKEGDVLHWWHEPQGKGTRTRFSDDRLWLPYAVAEYIRITGDEKILAQEVPYLVDTSLKSNEDERYTAPCVSCDTASLYMHCIKAVEISLRFGAHGLPLMGSGDWNDGMNTVGNQGRGESVWLGWFLYAVLDKMNPLCIGMGDNDRAKRYMETKNKLKEAIEQHAWDGKWYRRAFFDDGTPLGSSVNPECKIDSIAQSWAVLSGAGEAEHVKKAMQSLEDILVSWEEGLIKLLAPPFDKSELEPGYIKGYVPGVRENGGQYTHAAAWAIIAFAELADGDKAFLLYDLINPINHTANLRDCIKYKVEPYVMAADIYALHPHEGRGGWTWYTGSAGWMYRAGMESILGFVKKGENLVMDPCIPKKWRGYAIQYRYLDTTYRIQVKNPDAINKGVKCIFVDGVESNKTIPLINDGNSHDVQVIMGT